MNWYGNPVVKVTGIRPECLEMHSFLGKHIHNSFWNILKTTLLRNWFCFCYRKYDWSRSSKRYSNTTLIANFIYNEDISEFNILIMFYWKQIHIICYYFFKLVWNYYYYFMFSSFYFELRWFWQKYPIYTIRLTDFIKTSESRSIRNGSTCYVGITVWYITVFVNVHQLELDSVHTRACRLAFPPTSSVFAAFICINYWKVYTNTTFDRHYRENIPRTESERDLISVNNFIVMFARNE